MPHMLAQEHMSYVDALRYGTARNQATLAAALSAIGADVTTLVLTHTGDGVWTLSSSLTLPTNVLLFIPAGVTVFRPAGTTLTVEGPILAMSSSWETGPGLTVRGTTPTTELSSLVSTKMTIAAPLGTNALTIMTPGLIPQTQFFNQGAPNASPGLSFVLDPGNPIANWVVGNNANQNALFFISHINDNPHFAISHVGCWIGNGTVPPPTPLHLLHLQLDDAFKPGDGAWDFPSDQRVKTVLRPYTDGLAMLLALPDPVVYTLNGKADTPADGTEYVGMLGQAVQPVAPYMISTYQAKLEPSDPEPTDILTMNNSAMIYALLNAARELSARLDALEALTGQRVDNLEAVAHTHTGAGSAAGEVPFVPQGLAAEGTAVPEIPRPVARRKRQET